MNKGIARALLLSLLFSAVGLAFLLWLGPPLDLRLLWRADPLWLVAAVVGATGVWFTFASLRVISFCRDQGMRLPFLKGLRVHALALFGTMITPGGSGGAPAVAFALRYQGLPAAAGWAVAIGIFAVDTLFYAWSLPLALMVLIHTEALPNSSVWLPLGGIAIVLSASIAYLLLFRLGWLHTLAGALFRGPLIKVRRGALRTIERFVAASETFPYRRLDWHLRMQGLTLASWLGFFAVLPLVVGAFGPLPNPLAIIGFELVLQAVSNVVPTPGASGFFEASTGAYLLQLDPTLAAPAITITWRLITYYLYFLIGPPLGGYIVARMFASEG